MSLGDTRLNPNYFYFLLFLFFSFSTYAQQTIFNVPSADVLEPKTVYFEVDHYQRPWQTQSGDVSLLYTRGVVGVGGQVEVGVNLGPWDLIHSADPFADFAIKWKPWIRKFGGDGESGIYVGNQVGVGLSGDVKGEGRDFVYGNFYTKLPHFQTRIGAGGYFATQNVFESKSRFGAALTFEQPIPGIKGLTFATDWFSGDGASLTPGIIYSIKALTLYAGYAFANTGRDDDLVTLEVGFGFY